MTMTEAKHVIILGIDGLRPDQIRPDMMPNLHALKQRGVSSNAHRTVFPSETRCALTALANGAKPESSGVVGNDFYLRTGSHQLAGTETIHEWRLNEMSAPGGFVRTAGLGETLSKAGKAFAVVTSSGQGSFTALNWKGADFGQTGFNVRHPQLAYPADLAVEISRRHKVPAGGIPPGAERRTVEIFTQSIWPVKKPAASIIWITEGDGASHRHGLGAEGQLASIAACDQAIGDILDWREAQPEREDIAIFVTSDHGHATISRFVSVTDTLAQAGIRAASEFSDGIQVIMRHGSAPAMWLRDYDTVLLTDIHDALRAQDWYGATFTRAAEAGSHFGRIDGTLALELAGIDHFRAPDLFINLAGDNNSNAHGFPGSTVVDATKFNVEPGGGTHGGLHIAELSAVLIGDGAGLKSGGNAVDTRTGIYDLAPTTLKMLGIEQPYTMTGRVMDEMFDGGPSSQPWAFEDFAASADGRTSHLRVGQLGASRYLEEAWAS